MTVTEIAFGLVVGFLIFAALLSFLLILEDIVDRGKLWLKRRAEKRREPNPWRRP